MSVFEKAFIISLLKNQTTAMNSIQKILLSVSTIILCCEVAAQTRFWANPYFAPGVSFTSAAIKINGVPSTYDSLLKIDDTSLLKVEVYDKKLASKMLGQNEGKKGVVLVTTRTHKPFEYVIQTTTDSAKYFVMNGDTIFMKASTRASIGGDTTSNTWNKFLEKNLQPQVPADNGAPPGRYWTTVRFFVNTDGSVSNPTIEEDPGYGIGPEVLRLMSKSPAWQPAVYNGRNVKAYQQQVVIFEVTEM